MPIALFRVGLHLIAIFALVFMSIKYSNEPIPEGWPGYIPQPIPEELTPEEIEELEGDY